MATTDRRESAVYVTIEDQSYVATTIEQGRTVFGVILSDRGEHNKIVRVTSKGMYQKLFGKPDFRYTSQTHYQLDRALDLTGDVLVCRVCPFDATMANANISIPTPQSEVIAHNYTFTSLNEDGSNKDAARIVICEDIEGYDAFNVGDWIYANTVDLEDNESQYARQILSKEHDLESDTYEFILDEPYRGSSISNNYARKLYTWSIGTTEDLTDENSLDSLSDKILYHFYAIGAGKWYNKLVLKGYRNTSLEKMYVDNDGNALFPYLFMDLSLYEVEDNGKETRLEGPWTVSLTYRTPDGSKIVNINTGEELFIENIINTKSDLIRCVSSGGSAALTETGETGDKNRLQVQLLFSQAATNGITGVVAGGVRLQGGFDGTSNGYDIYDNRGYLTLNDEERYSELWGLLSQAYAGTLVARDGSIEQLRECVYPVYQPDYIVSGGMPSVVQNSAQELAAFRQDCIHLGDTGLVCYSADDEIERRSVNVPWNSWNSALYAQYRQQFDDYTGTWAMMSPVLHAIERHLSVDGDYWIAEPVAGITKGAISDEIKLAYKPNHTQRGDLTDVQLNVTLSEPDGVYFNSQYTTYKQLSKLQRLHVAKFVAYVKKTIPNKLKDLLHSKATSSKINEAISRCNQFMSTFVEDPSDERYTAITSYTVSGEFDDVTQELNIRIAMTPIGSIERINVTLVVE